MSPKAFAAALRNFAAAVALSPDPAKSVAELAELMAVRADRDQVLLDALAKAMGKLCWAAPPAFQDSFVTPALAFIKGDSDTMPDLGVDLMFGEERHAGPLDHDELAFPPLSPLVQVREGFDVSEAALSVMACEAAGLAPEVWAAMPGEEQAVHRTLALSKLRQEQSTDTAAA